MFQSKLKLCTWPKKQFLQILMIMAFQWNQWSTRVTTKSLWSKGHVIRQINEVGVRIVISWDIVILCKLYDASTSHDTSTYKPAHWVPLTITVITNVQPLYLYMWTYTIIQVYPWIKTLHMSQEESYHTSWVYTSLHCIYMRWTPLCTIWVLYNMSCQLSFELSLHV